MCTLVFDINGLRTTESRLRKLLGQKYDGFMLKLVVVTPKLVGPPLRKYSYTQTNGVIVLPRSLITKLGRITRITVPDGQPAKLPSHGTLYPNQVAVRDHILDKIFTPERAAVGQASCLLDMKAGYGKTFLAAALISAIGGRTLFIVTLVELANQAVADLNGFFGTRVAGRNHIALPINVVVVNTAMKMSRGDLAEYRMCVLDEAHTYCTNARQVVFSFGIKYMLGMTATSGDRRDGGDFIARHSLGVPYDDDRMVEANGRPAGAPMITYAEAIDGFEYDDTVKFDCHARIVYYHAEPEHARALQHAATDSVFVHYMYAQFTRDEKRLMTVIEEIARLYAWRDGELRHRIFVFEEEVYISELLAHIFCKRISIPIDHEDVAMFVGSASRARQTTSDPGDSAGAIAVADARRLLEPYPQMPQKSRAAVRDTARVLFTTYAYASTGISIPTMTAMVLATPRRYGYGQTFARILRRGSNTAVPRVVVDVVDEETCLRKQVVERCKSYKLYGFAIEPEHIYAKNIQSVDQHH